MPRLYEETRILIMIQRIKTKVKVLRADPHMQEVARGTFIAFVLKIIGSGLAFGFNVAIARLLGADGAGIYFLALAVTTISSVIGRVGLDNALLRFVATQATHRRWDDVLGVYALGLRLAIVVSGLVTVVIFLASPWMAVALFDKPELTEPLRWMSISILPFALLNLQAESLKGLKRIRAAMLVQGVGVPLLSLSLMYPLIQVAGVTGLALAYVASTALIALLGGWAWYSATKQYDNGNKTFPLKKLWASSRPLFVVSLMNNGIRAWLPLLILGYWGTNEEVGIFGAELRIVALTTMMLFTINNVLAPKIAELYAKGEIEALALTARRSATLLILMSSPLFCVLIFFPHWVLSMFGDEFKKGGVALAILAIGQIVNVFAGTLGTILIVSGNEHYIQKMTLIFTFVLVLLLLIFVPNLGLLGAALSIAVSGTGLSLVTVFQAEKIIGMRVVPGFVRVRDSIKL